MPPSPPPNRMSRHTGDVLPNHRGTPRFRCAPKLRNHRGLHAFAVLRNHMGLRTHVGSCAHGWVGMFQFIDGDVESANEVTSAKTLYPIAMRLSSQLPMSMQQRARGSSYLEAETIFEGSPTHGVG